MRYFGRVGRRHTFIITATMPALAGLMRAYSTSYSMYVTLEYFEALFASGAYTTGYILGTYWLVLVLFNLTELNVKTIPNN